MHDSTKLLHSVCSYKHAKFSFRATIPIVVGLHWVVMWLSRDCDIEVGINLTLPFHVIERMRCLNSSIKKGVMKMVIYHLLNKKGPSWSFYNCLGSAESSRQYWKHDLYKARTNSSGPSRHLNQWKISIKCRARQWQLKTIAGQEPHLEFCYLLEIHPLCNLRQTKKLATTMTASFIKTSSFKKNQHLFDCNFHQARYFQHRPLSPC